MGETTKRLDLARPPSLAAGCHCSLLPRQTPRTRTARQHPRVQETKVTRPFGVAAFHTTSPRSFALRHIEPEISHTTCKKCVKSVKTRRRKSSKKTEPLRVYGYCIDSFTVVWLESEGRFSIRTFHVCLICSMPYSCHVSTCVVMWL